jgi:RimJ/RimL family protein N-acetyltransferase
VTRRPLTPGSLLEDDNEGPFEAPDVEVPTASLTSAAEPIRPHDGRRQTFLVGPTIFLRPVELADAELSMFWRRTPFPTPRDISEEQLLESIPADSASGTKWLVACRRSDGMPMGSLQMSSDDRRTTSLHPHVAPIWGPNRVSAITAEIVRLVVPWLIHERDQLTVWVEMPAGDTQIEQAAKRAGMFCAYRYREALIGPNGGRQDLECWQALHPTWLARLGAPPESVQGQPQLRVRSPAPLHYDGREDEPPANAMIVGNRIYLRPMEQADAEELARWTMRETDTAFDSGRRLRSPISYWHWNRKHAGPVPPAWTRFAIVTLDGDVVIGSNGLAYVDWVNRTAETETEIARPSYRSNGYGTEAKHLLLEYGFDMLGLHMVRSLVWAFNTRSCGALRKQGYRDAGRLAWTGMKSGEMADDLAFDLLAEEWRAARR